MERQTVCRLVVVSHPFRKYISLVNQSFTRLIWYPRRDSNPDCQNRNLKSYPLDYGGITDHKDSKNLLTLYFRTPHTNGGVARIETPVMPAGRNYALVAPLVGAWIETCRELKDVAVNPLVNSYRYLLATETHSY